MTDYHSVRAARVTFGLALIAGVPRIVIAGVMHRGGDVAANAIGQTWLFALIAGVVAAVAAHWFPRIRFSFASSLVIPWVGIVLVLPITIHCIWIMASSNLRGFDEWVAMSALATGAAHLLGAGFVGYRAWQLSRGQQPISPLAIFGWTLLASNLPLPLLPMMFVAPTGIAVVLLMYALDPLAKREFRTQHELELPIAQLR